MRLTLRCKCIILVFCGILFCVLGAPGEAAENLLTNPSGETGDLSGWTIIANGGGGWAVSGTAVEGSKSFITSYNWCKKSQEIDLLAKGFSVEYLDSALPVEMKEYFRGTWPNYGDNFYLTVQLRDANHHAIATYATGNFTGTNSWQEKSHTFSGYGSGLRYIYFEDGSDDAEYWAGHYGGLLDGASIILAGTAGVTVLEANGTSVQERGNTDSFQVRLDKQPSENVTVALNYGSDITVDPQTLTFTAANWYQAQTVTITAYDDLPIEGEHTDTISFAVTSADGNYNGLSVDSVSITVTEDDNPVAGFGTALDFDGTDDYVEVTSTGDISFSGSSSFTIALWAKPADVIIARRVRAIY